MRMSGFLAAIAATSFLLGPGVVTPAQAEPQMLGVIVTATPVPLQCAGGECSAELTSICLHQARATPIRGYPYTAFDADAIAVTAREASGRTVSLPAGEVLRFAAARGFSTVRVSLAADVLAARGLHDVAVRVERPLTLVPAAEPGPGDTDPLTETDVALGAGPLRTAAKAIVDRDTDTMHASQVLARMIDALPKWGRAETGGRAALWETAAAAHASSYSRTGVHRARTAYNRCYRTTRIGDKTLRGCLAEGHDDFVRDLNVRYWDAVKAGF
jgi:hypothetical protein